ncbi:extracellular solute-binding protein [Paenibacillus sp. LMG 31456]|uniref:Extracellular solute-binding protein n=1 Tax=Paenibacillus foliorum TaxID=2654974 RepID=A0A972GQK0_9BACL|nr:extracellular solute-binding protein [Paenibacillus foliorum]NOU94977.1 extracellular solute-binding protein [Paenibacillus foliorum]
MKSNRLLTTALTSALSLSMVLTGCSSESGKSTEGAKAPAGEKSTKPVEISIWGGWPELDPWFQKMADEFKKTNPNVTVSISSFPLRDYEKKVAAALPSKSGADILPLNPNLALRYIQGNMLQATPEDLVKQVNSGIHQKLVVDNTKVKDKTYGVPALMGAGAIYYNKDMLKEAGLTAPPTADQLLEYAQKLAKRDASGNLERAGMSLRLSGGGSGVGEKFWNLLAQRGGSIIKEASPGKYKADYNTDAGLQTLKMYVDMVHKYKTDDPKVKHDTEAFQTKLAAFYVRESNVIIDTKKKAPDLNYDAAPLKANVVSIVNFYVSSAQKEKAEAAWNFIRFITKPENHAQMIAMTGWLPARDDLDLSNLYKDYPQYKAFFTKQDLQAYPPVAEFDEILTKFADRLATKGFTDASFVDNPEKMKAFLDEAAKETNDILKKAGVLAE